MSRILLVEPNKLLAQTYQIALEANGYEVTLARGAQEAIMLLDEGVVDLIVLEPQLPKHNGIEFLYELRSYPDWRDLPVVLHTLIPPDSLRRSREALESLGVNGYLYKPACTLAQLVSLIASILRTAVV